MTPIDTFQSTARIRQGSSSLRFYPNSPRTLDDAPSAGHTLFATLGIECEPGRLGKLQTSGMMDEGPEPIVTSQQIFGQTKHHLARDRPPGARDEPHPK